MTGPKPGGPTHPTPTHPRKRQPKGTVPEMSNLTPTPDPIATTLAAELHRIADVIAAFAGPHTGTVRAALSIHEPFTVRDDEPSTRAFVDAVGRALLGQPGKPRCILGATWRYESEAERGPLHISVSGRISDPTIKDREAELAELRAEVAALRAQEEARTVAAVLTPDAEPAVMCPQGDPCSHTRKPSPANYAF